MEELKRIEIPDVDIVTVWNAIHHLVKGEAWCCFYAKGDTKLEHPYVFCHGSPNGKLRFNDEEVDPGTFLNNIFPKERIPLTKDITFISCFGWFFRAGIWHGITVRHINPSCATRMGITIIGNEVVAYKDASVVNSTLRERWQDLYIAHLVKPLCIGILWLRKLLGRPRKAIKQYN